MARAEDSIFPVAFLLKALTVSFGLWAGAVVWGVDQVTTEMRQIAARQEAFAKEFAAYVTQTEGRIARLEQITIQEHGPQSR